MKYNKAYQGGAGGAAGGAMAVITAWILEANGIVVPGEVQTAMALLFPFFGGLIVPIFGPANA